MERPNVRPASIVGLCPDFPIHFEMFVNFVPCQTEPSCRDMMANQSFFEGTTTNLAVAFPGIDD